MTHNILEMTLVFLAACFSRKTNHSDLRGKHVNGHILDQPNNPLHKPLVPLHPVAHKSFLKILL